MAIQAINDIATTLNANYKQVYADDISFVIPEGVKLLKDMKFVPAEQQQGGTYNQPLALGLEHGMTYAAGDVAANLNAAVSGKLENATVNGYQMIMRAQLAYAVASRGAKSKNAFRQGPGLVLESMLFGHKKRAEAALWYGQQGLTTVASVASSVITCTAAEWAEGLWVGMVNCPIDVYNSTTLRQSCNITAIDPVNRTLTVDTIGAIAAGDTIYYRGAYGNEMLGVHKAMAATTSTIWNIAQSTYPDLWVSTTYSASSATLSYGKVVRAAAKSLPKGGEGRFKVYTHPESYQDLVNEPEAAKTASDYWKPGMVERGTDALKFHCVTGIIEVVPCTYVKRGYAYGLLQDGCWKRIGSADVGPRIPGLQSEEQVFLHMPNTSGVEMRSFSDFAPFCDKLGAQFLITGIVPSS